MIATRQLHIQSDGKKTPVEVRVHEPHAGDGCWDCKFEIDWPEAPMAKVAHGVDAVQALTIAMQMIGLHLYLSPYHEAGTLVFDRPGNGYGFPIMKDRRDLLVGDDARFDGN